MRDYTAINLPHNFLRTLFRQIYFAAKSCFLFSPCSFKVNNTVWNYHIGHRLSVRKVQKNVSHAYFINIGKMKFCNKTSKFTQQFYTGRRP